MIKSGKKSFGLLCWNIQKSSLTPEFQKEFLHLLQNYSSDLVALQEVKLPQGAIPGYFQHFWHALSPNFKRVRHRFGVMTLSTLPIVGHTPLKTVTREAGIATRKSALLTSHDLPDGTRVALLNIHAINFVPYRLFAKELNRIMELIERVEERRFIVAGDFNTWSRKRERLLESAIESFGLKSLEPENRKLRKSIMGVALDRIYYRGLDAASASVIETPISDHNPIYASFSI